MLKVIVRYEENLNMDEDQFDWGVINSYFNNKYIKKRGENKYPDWLLDLLLEYYKVSNLYISILLLLPLNIKII